MQRCAFQAAAFCGRPSSVPISRGVLATGQVQRDGPAEPDFRSNPLANAPGNPAEAAVPCMLRAGDACAPMKVLILETV
jgi:hypothetical protein